MWPQAKPTTQIENANSKRSLGGFFTKKATYIKKSGIKCEGHVHALSGTSLGLQVTEPTPLPIDPVHVLQS